VPNTDDLLIEDGLEANCGVAAGGQRVGRQVPRSRLGDPEPHAGRQPCRPTGPTLARKPLSECEPSRRIGSSLVAKRPGARGWDALPLTHLFCACPALPDRDAGPISPAPVAETFTHLPYWDAGRRRPHRACNCAPPSAGPGEPGCKLAPLLRGSAAALPEGFRQHRCHGEKLLAVVFEQQEPRVRNLQPFPQRGGAGGRQISAIGALARLYRHGAFLR